MILIQRDAYSKTSKIVMGKTTWIFPLSKEYFLVDDADLPSILNTGTFSIINKTPELLKSAFLVRRRKKGFLKAG